MKDFDFILSDEQYSKLQNEYNSSLKSTTEFCVRHLNSIISTLQINGFKMPITFQNKILTQLIESQQILNIIFIDTYTTPLNLNNNPLKLLYELALLSSNLNSYSIKSPYQILFLKTNALIIDCIMQILKQFSN